MGQTQGSLTMKANRAARRCNRLCLPNRYRPTPSQWKVLYALQDGLLPVSLTTVVGGHVARPCAVALADAGLVMIDDDDRVGLTDRGRDRLEVGW